MSAPRRLKVNSPRNSDCAISLTHLDWSSWLTRGAYGGMYLDVRHKDGNERHLVWCKHGNHPRLMMTGGVLYWLVGR